MLSLLVLVVAAGLHAQEIPDRKVDGYQPHAREKGKHHHDEMYRQLNLTDQQRQQFKTERQAMRQQFEELRKNQDISVKEYKSRMESIRKENKSRMENILTPEQRTHLQELRKDKAEKMRAHAQKQQEEMKTRLGLSEEQSAKLDKSRKEWKDKMKSIHDDKTLNDEQKKEQYRSLQQQQKESMKSILTEDQMKKWKESRHPHRDAPPHKAPARERDKKETI